MTERMLADARSNRQGLHVSNLGCALGQALAHEAMMVYQAMAYQIA